MQTLNPLPLLLGLSSIPFMWILNFLVLSNLLSKDLTASRRPMKCMACSYFPFRAFWIKKSSLALYLLQASSTNSLKLFDIVIPFAAIDLHFWGPQDGSSYSIPKCVLGVRWSMSPPQWVANFQLERYSSSLKQLENNQDESKIRRNLSEDAS